MGHGASASTVEVLEARRLMSAGAEVSLGAAYAPGDYWGSSVHQQQAAADAGGNLLTVRQDAGGANIYAQWRNADLQPVGAELFVATRAGSTTALPQVDVAADGTAVVAWADNGGNGFNVFAKVFRGPSDTTGRQLTVTTGKGKYVSAQGTAPAISANGNLVVTWHLHEANWGRASIHAQRLDLAGRKLGKSIEVSPSDEGGHRSAAVDMDDAGNFVVVYPLGGAENFDIVARRYGSNGALLGGGRFLVSNHTAGYQVAPNVSMAPTPGGGFVVGWHGEGAGIAGQPINGSFARPFAGDGTALADQVLLEENSYGATVRYGRDGNSFAAAWARETTERRDTAEKLIAVTSTAIVAETYALDGASLGTRETVAQHEYTRWKYVDGDGTVHTEGAAEKLTGNSIALVNLPPPPAPPATGESTAFAVLYQRDLDFTRTSDELRFGKVWTPTLATTTTMAAANSTSFFSDELLEPQAETERDAALAII